jgi:hypothetical protein
MKVFDLIAFMKVSICNYIVVFLTLFCTGRIEWVKYMHYPLVLVTRTSARLLRLLSFFKHPPVPGMLGF